MVRVCNPSCWDSKFRRLRLVHDSSGKANWTGEWNVMVAKWDDVSKVMLFDGEGKEIRETYKKLMAERRGEEGGEFSE